MKEKEVIEENANQLNIELSEEIADGIYCNLAIISHSNAEFVIDYVRMLPGLPKAKVKSRIIMTPQHAKRLMFAMQDNIQKFESQFGKIDIKDGDMKMQMTFGGQGGTA